MMASSSDFFHTSNLSSMLAQMPHALWRANEMAVYQASTLSSGFAVLDAELMNGGWPCSMLVELLLPHAGIGEIQLLKPALAAITRSQRIALIQPPHIPNGLACRAWGLAEKNLLWINTKQNADALWATEQILKNGCCGAVLLWQSQTHIRLEALRRLHLLAQAQSTYFFMLRPISAQHNSSPAPLRLALQPALRGIQLQIVKRRGPSSHQTLFIPLSDMPVHRHVAEHALEQDHAHVDQPALAAFTVRNASPLLV
jgi:protein ImuA